MSVNFVPQLFWVDLEMSGLDPLENRILEFACILTDGRLQYQHEGPHLIMQCDEEHLKCMDEWNTRSFFS
jgi:oligoribonuclease